MTTKINGEAAEWPEDVWAKWRKAMDGLPELPTLSANYYTPRPYVDEWNRGRDTSGFVYTIVKDGHPTVCTVQLAHA